VSALAPRHVASVVAFGAISAAGEGAAAFAPGRVGEPAVSHVGRDAVLEAAGLAKPFVARVQSVAGEPDPARALLVAAARNLAGELDRRHAGWRELRIGIALGTSSGGLASFLDALSVLDDARSVPRDLARRAPYFGPLELVAATLGVRAEHEVQLLAACASSSFALGQALGWLSLDVVDLVIAGGYDAVTPFVAAGFEALGATSSAPAPFRGRRSGLALGEGAALLALTRNADTALGHIRGFAAASDGMHVTAPDREARGLVRAVQAALESAGVEPRNVGLVSAHGTGTPYNDAAEAKCLESVLGTHAEGTVVTSFKGSVGHTLGAAGALETLHALSALDAGLAPATCGSGAVDAACPCRVLDRGERSATRVCLKLSSAFGGANAALVLTQERPPGVSPRARPVYLQRVGPAVEHIDVQALESLRVLAPGARVDRIDPLSGLVLLAIAALREENGFATQTGVVCGTAAATLEIDADFERRRRRRRAEPRRFPATSPNLCAGEASIAYQLLGPSFTVGASPAAGVEALLVAHDWVSAGLADRLVVVGVEHVDACVRSLWPAAGWPTPRGGAVAAILGVATSGALLERGRLVAATEGCRQNRGSFGGKDPGWPSFLAALEESARGG